MSEITDAIDGLLDEALALDPCAAVLDCGVTTIPGLTDFGPDGHAARADAARRAGARLRSLPATTPEDVLLRDHVLERMATRVDMFEAGEPLRELHPTPTGPLQVIAQSVRMAVPTDWEQALLRLRDVPAALAGYRAGLRAAARAGHVAAEQQIAECVRRCAGWAEQANGVATAYGDGPLAGELASAAAVAGDAYTDLEAFLRTELAPLAGRRDAFGRERYGLWVRHFLGAAPDLDELYAWGWDELLRVESQLSAEADRLVPGGGPADAVAWLDGPAGPGALASAEEFVDWLQRLLDETMARLDGVHLRVPDPLRRLVAVAGRDSGIQYLAPTQDLTRPGRVSWSLGPHPPYPTWNAYATAYHEGVPGHHLQLGLAACRGDTRSQRLNVLGGLSAGAEGWALYAEGLMDELGYFTAPGARLGLLVSQALRAARIVLDIGLHLRLPIPAGVGFADGAVWIPALGRHMLTERVLLGPQEAGYELVRYLGRPGQALAYKAGERVYRDVRAAARSRPGFDLASFHDAVLGVSGAGLGHLRDALTRATTLG